MKWGGGNGIGVVVPGRHDWTHLIGKHKSV